MASDLELVSAETLHRIQSRRIPPQNIPLHGGWKKGTKKTRQQRMSHLFSSILLPTTSHLSHQSLPIRSGNRRTPFLIPLRTTRSVCWCRFDGEVGIEFYSDGDDEEKSGL